MVLFLKNPPVIFGVFVSCARNSKSSRIHCMVVAYFNYI